MRTASHSVPRMQSTKRMHARGVTHTPPVVGIQALDPAGKWVRLYQEKPRVELYNQKFEAKEYTEWAPRICRVDFKVSVLRFELDTETIEDWNYMDFVEVFGSRSIPSALLEPADTS